jgi:TetR/AcrR family transcriptional repressor of nem operon
MPRPRTFEREAVLAAAKDAFWEKGYDGTALSDLEDRTGLNRSSLYLEFGSKQGLFSAALDLYYAEVVDPLLGAMEADPHLSAIDDFFAGVKQIILDDRSGSRRGCLLVNTIAELSPYDDAAARRARQFRDRLNGAFERVLEAEASTARIADGSTDRLAGVLLASTLGIWVCARIDLDDAADRCDLVAAEVHTLASALGIGSSVPSASGPPGRADR